ncbi:chloramphenicol acetyltransferase [Mameliella sediminis]|uniref:chloramphenicol acetyltransferase n=1 Tax=Mameliella sediminis TaxID=2836866 RepID=UPI001C4801FB|nr:chloramphenicol acetyltransferase [Mameliella sediminis]MBY6113389.1 chloramphenicol acetyltransferase [Antarctobacter heliothermus]MBY6143263.1 chloramphenicol acetyltransferase [Mameliella alba]MBV7394687.1 chloramphenicol acetyltransferase [Mameliella sediminis]MBY6163136.1 chloramphenicol acetyltransferase [Mameliella alba]MBY6171400.1 chloramphenicol acetyltransferase [Mameliella alba]
MKKLSADGALFHDGCTVTNSDFGPYTEVGQGSRIANTRFGAYSYCDRYADIANAEVGKFANIASFTRIGATDHPLDRASLHHFMYRSASYWDDAADDADWFAHRAGRMAKIGHDTWIGHNAQVKPEVTIGNGAVVASGAIVTRDVAPYTIVAGIPAKPVRDRLPQELAERIEALGWWEWGHDALRDALEDFRKLSVPAFLEKYET